MPLRFSLFLDRAAPAVQTLQVSLRVVEESQTELGTLLTKLDTHKYGLTAAQSRQRLRQFGHNEITHDSPSSWYGQLLHGFNNPFVYLLLGLAIASWLMGDIQGMGVLLAIVLLSGLFRFGREYHSTKVAAKLRTLVNVTVTISRYNDLMPRERRQEIPIHNLVPGDIVHLLPGKMVPADVRLLEAKDLFVSQAILTGESTLVQKHDTLGNPVEKIAIRYARPNPPDPLDTPTICFMGTTVMGGTARAVVVATGNQTYLGSLAQAIAGKRALTSFEAGVNRVTWLLIGFMAVMVPIAFLLNSISRGQQNAAFFFAIAVAIGLVPEMLPLIVSLNLTRGTNVLAKQQVLVKRVDAIQNLGAIDVLCTDKTGTLTQNQVSLAHHIDPLGQDSPETLNYAYLNSYYQTGVQNLLDAAVLKHTELEHSLHLKLDYRKLGEVPFDFVRRRLSVVLEHEGQPLLICKGAVEEIVTLCSTAKVQGRVVRLTEDLYRQSREVAQRLNSDGFRVLAIAYKRFGTPKEHYAVEDEFSLTLVGYLAFLDPPKESAREAIAALQANHVAVKIITGDTEAIARKICQDVGLTVQWVHLGAVVERMTDAELAAVVEETTIFAKMSPAQKARVVRALKQRGHTVGYLGDGINDALALRDADVGISVDTAVDVAKESADIILLEKSLLVLAQGIQEGRRTFGNLIKYIKMATSSNFGNVFSVLGASIFLPFLPMLPIQLLIQNLLYDLSQTTIPFDRVDEDYLATPQRWSVRDLRRFMLCLGPVSSVFDYATFAVLWFGLEFNTPEAAPLFQSGWFVEGLLSQTLIIHVIRTAKLPFFQSTATLPVLVLTGLVMAIALILPFTSLGATFGLVSLPARYFLWLVMILVSYCLLTQRIKVWYIQQFGKWL